MDRKVQQPSAPPWKPDATTPRDRHRLEGLEPDNLLAFISLIGLLRALEAARPAWRPRAFWDVEADPWRPVLTLAEAQTEADLAQAAAEGVRTLLSPLCEICSSAAQHAQQRATSQIGETEKKIKDEAEKGKDTSKLKKQLDKLKNQADQPRAPEKVVQIASSAHDLWRIQGSQDRERNAWIACLSAWAQSRHGEKVAESSPLKLTSGQQAFAGIFVTLAQACDADELARSLYQPWRYMHRGDSFRLDGAEARRYAYMAGDPTDKALWTVSGQTGTGVAPSERGANTLAAAGFRSFPIFTLRRDIAIPGMDRKNHEFLRIPIWTTRGGRGATRAGIESLLWQGGDANSPPHPGVLGWQQFRIYEISDSPTSKYKSVAHDGFIVCDVTPATPP